MLRKFLSLFYNNSTERKKGMVQFSVKEVQDLGISAAWLRDAAPGILAKMENADISNNYNMAVARIEHLVSRLNGVEIQAEVVDAPVQEDQPTGYEKTDPDLGYNQD